MIVSKIENSIIKFITNQASKSELDDLEVWLQDDNNKQLFKDYVKTNYAVDFNLRKFDLAKIKGKVLTGIDEENKTIKLRKTKRVISYAAAAAIFLGVVILELN